ncbi:glutathione S-transferase [Aspergillus pseudotamarii]|uniref:Glutathione S-transferase n=1 Tax=Aspergillus pseudotamarii TaxID=132259 RepID=A0A5N6TBM2_ASPPS|nr:glutathione S-transferase [Aspergillus pseudotamarii]KAE8143775.1 glutathione S-transferase [Aspergillus pseudotamarii]
MVEFGQIYAFPGNPRGARAQVIAALGGLDVPFTPGFIPLHTNRTEEFKQKFPMGKIPTLEVFAKDAEGNLIKDKDGNNVVKFSLVEGLALATYLASKGGKASQLLGTTDEASAKIMEWVSFAETELTIPSGDPITMTARPLQRFNEKLYQKKCKAVAQALDRLELELKKGNKFLVGQKITIADVFVGSWLHFGVAMLVDAEWRKQIPHCMRYLQGISEIPEFRKTFGDVTMVQERPVAPPPDQPLLDPSADE